MQQKLILENWRRYLTEELNTTPEAQTLKVDLKNPSSILTLVKQYSKMSSGSPGPDQTTKQNLATDETKKLLASLPSVKTNPSQAFISLINMFNLVLSDEDKAEVAQAVEKLQQAASQKTSQFKENQQVGTKAYLMLHNALNKLGNGNEEKGIEKVANGALIASLAFGIFSALNGDITGVAGIVSAIPKIISSSKSSDILGVIGAGVEVVTESKKKSKSGDRCTRIAKRKYDVWPSAYASGAVVKCRQGKIWKGISENMSDQEIDDALLLEEVEVIEEEWSEKYKRSIDCKNPKGFSQRAHCQGKKKNEDIDLGQVEIIEEAKKKAYKPNFSKEKEQGLHGWFARNDGKGWVNCRTGGPCGRDSADKGGKYPACRPTKAQCKSAGKGPLRKKKSSSPISWTKKKKKD
jgi:hypothetical protein